MSTWGSFEIFELENHVKDMMPDSVNSFQEWVDGLSVSELGDYILYCNKEKFTDTEYKQLQNMALSIFFKENDIDRMPLENDLISKIVNEFINCILMISLKNQGVLHIEGPILLKNQVISCMKVKTYSL